MSAASVAAFARFVAAGWALATFAFYAFSSETFHERGIVIGMNIFNDLGIEVSGNCCRLRVHSPPIRSCA